MIRIIGVGIVVVLLAPFATWASAGPPASNLPDVLQQLRDPDWQIRRNAFYRLIPNSEVILSPEEFLTGTPQEIDDMKVALIQVLETENAVVGSGISLDEAYSEYAASLIHAVSSFKDARAVSALLGAITTGGMATTGLAEIGAAAAEPVIEALRSNDVLVRHSASIVLDK